MTEREAAMDAEGALAYSYRPSLLGAPWNFTLVGETLEYRAGRRSGRIALRQIRRIRLSFRPVTMQTRRFVTEIWAEDAPKIEICSSSWKSMVEQEKLDRAYATFVMELHRRLASAGVPTTFEQGSSPLLYWPGLAIFLAASLGLAALTVVALEARIWSGAVIVAVFFMFLLWQSGNFFRRNLPGIYRADALPPLLLPPG